MKKTQKDRVAEKLRADGFVDNFWCLENKVSLRLGAIIHDLKGEGWQFDEERSGYVAGTKNWRYYVANTPKPPPKMKITFVERDGQTIAAQSFQD